jgi:acyl-coenzyme A synthetase/AMP-(fatty) acid ligase
VSHPSIARAIVVGISHPKYVEVPVAFLQLEDGTQQEVGQEGAGQA